MGLDEWTANLLGDYSAAYSANWGDLITDDFQLVTGRHLEALCSFAGTSLPILESNPFTRINPLIDSFSSKLHRIDRHMNGDGNGIDPYHAAGELAGITSLVDAFYANMDSFPEARVIRRMHPDDLTESRKKLTYFLCGVLGGPRLYIDHYGGINLPDFHSQFPIGYAERDAWMLCMQRAIAIQPYEASCKEFLVARLSIPAERIRLFNATET